MVSAIRFCYPVQPRTVADLSCRDAVADLSFREAVALLSRRWKELASKSATVADLSFRDAVALLSGPAEKDAEGKPVVQPFTWPPLEPGFSYMAMGRSRYGTTLLLVDPHPNHEGFWVLAAMHFFHGGENAGGFSETFGRGVRLDDPLAQEGLQKYLIESCDFQPDKEGWLAGPPDPRPYAVGVYKQAWQESMEAHAKRENEDDSEEGETEP